MGKAPLTVAASGARISSDEFSPINTQEMDASEAIALAEHGVLGREKELAEITEATRHALAERRPRVVVIEGLRGSGTTRMLIHTAHIAVTLDPSAQLAHGICVEGRDGEHAPFGRLLLARFGITPSSAEQNARARITTEVAEVLGTSDAVEVSTVAHLLGNLAGLSFPDSPILRAASSSEDELRRQTRDAAAKFFEAEARVQPLWLGIDNADRMDDVAWELIAGIAGRTASIVVVVAGTGGTIDAARRVIPEDALTAITLGPLGETDIAELVRRLVPDLDVVPDALVAAIAHRSGGLPSEVRQLVFSLFDTGLFVTGPGGRPRVDLERMERGELPISMDDAIRARLALLDAEERRTLEFAAICGERFWDGALLCQTRVEATDPAPPFDVEDHESDAAWLANRLASLVANGFVSPAEAGGVVPANEYRFSTVRLRSIVYMSMAEATRRARHITVARWLDVAAAQQRDAVSATVGFHLELGGDRTAAGEAYARAASLERSHRHLERALAWLDRAEACIPSTNSMAHLDLAHERGAVLVSLGRAAQAIVAFERMYAFARILGARAKQAAALDRIARTELARGAPARALTLLERALALGRTSRDRRAIAACLDDLAQAELVSGRSERATAAATEALELRRAMSDARGESVSLTTLGRIALRRGDLGVAEERLRAALVIRESLNDLEALIQTLTALGRVAFERADREAAIETWQRALQIAQQIGERRGELTLLSHIGEANLVLGRLSSADHGIVRAHELAMELGDSRAIARIGTLSARLAMRRGDDRALRTLRIALEGAESVGAEDVLGLAHRAIGQLHAMNAQHDSGAAELAARHFVLSVEAFERARSDKERARSLLDLGHLFDQCGDRGAALQQLRVARDLLSETQLPELGMAERMLARLS